MTIFQNRNLTLKATAGLLIFTLLLGLVAYFTVGLWPALCTLAGIFFAIWLVRHLVLLYIDGRGGVHEDSDERTKSVAHEAAHRAFWVIMSISFISVLNGNRLIEAIDSLSLLTTLYTLGLTVYVYTEIRLRMKA